MGLRIQLFIYFQVWTHINLKKPRSYPNVVWIHFQQVTRKQTNPVCDNWGILIIGLYLHALSLVFRLLAYTYEEGLHIDSFKLPIACSWHVSLLVWSFPCFQAAGLHLWGGPSYWQLQAAHCLQLSCLSIWMLFPLFQAVGLHLWGGPSYWQLQAAHCLQLSRQEGWTGCHSVINTSRRLDYPKTLTQKRSLFYKLFYKLVL